MKITIGRKAKVIMGAKEISQKQLSRATGIKQSNLSLILNDKRTPSTENFVKIADALYCKTDVLIERN